LLVDPRDPDGWAQTMTRVADDAALREDLCRRGALQVKAFSWEQSARGLLKVYQDLMKGKAA
jgi:glycosyltransferase involved in cell wall biosynthesis